MQSFTAEYRQTPDSVGIEKRKIKITNSGSKKHSELKKEHYKVDEYKSTSLS